MICKRAIAIKKKREQNSAEEELFLQDHICPRCGSTNLRYGYAKFIYIFDNLKEIVCKKCGFSMDVKPSTRRL